MLMGLRTNVIALKMTIISDSAVVLMMTMRKGWLADRGTNSEASPSTLGFCDAIVYGKTSYCQIDLGSLVAVHNHSVFYSNLSPVWHDV
jgi:hypothetical protein